MTSTPGFRHYVSLGDGISIDLYPGLDTAEREELAIPPEGLGAASLLHRNDDRRWPDFEGRDLASLSPGIGQTLLAAEGATTTRVLGVQLPQVPEQLETPLLVTLTAGGNDLLALLDLVPGRDGDSASDARLDDVRKVAEMVERIVDRVRGLYPASTVLVGTVYDPSDGTGKLTEDGVVMPDALEALDAFNDRIREMEDGDGVRVADLHGRFLGHGLSEPDPSRRWYWRRSAVAPSARGAHEVRRLWWETLTGEPGDGA